MMSRKDSVISYVLSWRRKMYRIQTGKMSHLPGGRSMSLGQQPGKHGYRRLIIESHRAVKIILQKSSGIREQITQWQSCRPASYWVCKSLVYRHSLALNIVGKSPVAASYDRKLLCAQTDSAALCPVVRGYWNYVFLFHGRINASVIIHPRDQGRRRRPGVGSEEDTIADNGSSYIESCRQIGRRRTRRRIISVGWTQRRATPAVDTARVHSMHRVNHRPTF